MKKDACSCTHNICTFIDHIQLSVIHLVKMEATVPYPMSAHVQLDGPTLYVK